jgi:hypothetical protein
MRAIFAAAMLLAASSARADFYDGNEFYEYCTGAKSLAIAYVGGWMDAYLRDTDLANLAKITSPDSNTRQHITFYADGIKAGICIPPKVTLGQLVDVICKHLADHPQDRHLPMGQHLTTAFRTAWPCSAQ